MLALQLLVYFFPIFRGRSCVKNKTAKGTYVHQELQQHLPVHDDTCDKSGLSICRRGTNKAWVVVSESLHERWVSKHSSSPQNSNILISVFSHTAVTDSALTESTTALVHFELSHGIWPQEREEGSQKINVYWIYLALLTVGWTLLCIKVLKIDNLPLEFKKKKKKKL